MCEKNLYLNPVMGILIISSRLNRCNCVICILILLCFPSLIVCQEVCLTGSFVDVQSWALEDGSLNFECLDPKYSLDCSNNTDALAELRLLMNRFENAEGGRNYIPKEPTELISDNKNLSDLLIEDIENIIFLSLARNNLNRVPLFYTNGKGKPGSNWKKLKYLSLYGNNFQENDSKPLILTSSHIVELNATDFEELAPSFYFSVSGELSNWAKDLSNLEFPNLLELDLRKCSIQVLYNDTFKSMPNLLRLYLSHNEIYQIFSMAFVGLSRLVHLDISDNKVKIANSDGTAVLEGLTIQADTFKTLTNLVSLDFSRSRITQTCAAIFADLSKTIVRLSLCYTKFPYMNKNILNNTNLKYLDISGNPALSNMDDDAFDGMKDSLEIVNANGCGLRSISPFKKLHNLRILSLPDNDIINLKAEHFLNLTNLQIIDLSYNRIKNWEREIFHRLKNLDVLMLDKNNLNLLTVDMLKDLSDVKYIKLGLNSFVCNCLVRELYEGALQNEKDIYYPEWFINRTKDDNPSEKLPSPENDDFYVNMSKHMDFQKAHIYYSDLIMTRKPIVGKRYNNIHKTADLIDFYANFTFKLLDWSPEAYQCTDITNNTIKNFFDEITCEDAFPRVEPPSDLNRTATLVIVLTCMSVIIVGFVIIVIWKWWKIRYFFLMLRDSAILSNIDNQSSEEDCEKLFVYDVFVSYCDEDRNWILDEFLPQIDCNPVIKACLHERDFQIGLSIFENIINCMDRSRALLMIVSNHFIMSQWCQFEMHLAQHRLLETRREQLILVLLEDIPRRRRPNTLHYLMMTKTYIVWPKKDEEKPIFWKRLKRAILSGTHKDKTSTA